MSVGAVFGLSMRLFTIWIFSQDKAKISDKTVWNGFGHA
jgi:hypothetical protein